MSNIKKAIVLILAILIIYAFANNNIILAKTFSDSNNSNYNASSNITPRKADNTVILNNVPINYISSNNTPIKTDNTVILNSVLNNNTDNSINFIQSSNSTENIPHNNTQFNPALIILIALALGMFSLI